MSRPSLTLLALVLALPAAASEEAASAPQPKARKLEFELVSGQRFTGSTTVSYTVTTTVREGDRETSATESIQRTENFLDEIHRAGHAGVLEIERTYMLLYTKARDSGDGRPNVYRSPLQGRTVKITERSRRRDVKLEGRGAMDPLARRTAGMELDWRDIFPDEAVRPGDAWDADADALGRRLAAFLDAGSRSKMRVRFEEVVEVDGKQRAKLYVDWTVEGMRDRSLFTKVALAGDVFFDFELKRVVDVDLVGNMVVRGALVASVPPRIVKGEGPVSLKTTVKPAPKQVEAAAGAD